MQCWFAFLIGMCYLCKYINWWNGIWFTFNKQRATVNILKYSILVWSQMIRSKQRSMFCIRKKHSRVDKIHDIQYENNFKLENNFFNLSTFRYFLVRNNGCASSWLSNCFHSNKKKWFTCVMKLLQYSSHYLLERNVASFYVSHLQYSIQILGHVERIFARDIIL